MKKQKTYPEIKPVPRQPETEPVVPERPRVAPQPEISPRHDIIPAKSPSELPAEKKEEK